jgi:two-component system, cell cycle sensor histidine kinase and response regulator CckA
MGPLRLGPRRAPGEEAGGGLSQMLRSSAGTAARDPLAWLIALLGIVVGTLVLWRASGWGDAAAAARVVDLPALPAVALMIAGAVKVVRSGRLEPRRRRAFVFAIVAVATSGIADGIKALFPATAESWILVVPPVASFVVAGVALLGMLSLRRRAWYDATVFGLDALIVAWAATMIFWHFRLYDIGQAVGAADGQIMSAALFPVADIAMAFIVASIVAGGVGRSMRYSLTVCVAALLVIAGADLALGANQLAGAPATTGPSGALYSIAWWLFAFGVYLLWLVPDEAARGDNRLSRYAGSMPWLPVAAIAAGFVLPAIQSWDKPELLQQHVEASALLIGLVLARLIVAARRTSILAALELERLAAAVDQAADLTITADREGRLTYANPAFSRITGIAATDAVGRLAVPLGSAADPTTLTAIGSALERGEPWEGRLAGSRADGSPLQLDLSVAPVREPDGEISGWVARGRDVTRELEVESRLSQLRSMDSLGRLAGGAAHELNNVHTAIRGFGELALARVPSGSEVAADIDEVLRASDRAATLTRALLAYSGKLFLQPSRTDVNELVTGLLPVMRILAGSDVSVEISAAAEALTVLVDRAQLEKAITAITANAREAMPSGGRIEIAVGRRDIDENEARTRGMAAGPCVAVSISDTGVGMSGDVLGRIFEPFYTTKGPGAGPGLGLSTAMGILRSSGGGIDARSAPGKGSVFTLLVPLLREESRPTEATSAALESGIGAAWILVVDDEATICRVLERSLTRAGYRVRVADGGPTAIATAGEMDRIDLLLTDVVMPGMDGPDLAAHLQSERPGLRVMFMSGHPEGTARPEDLTAEATHFLPKPFDVQSLIESVRRALTADTEQGAGTSAAAD